MSDQTTPRPDSQGTGAQGPDGPPPAYEPPQFVPPQGPEIPAPPLYDWSKGGTESGSQYGGSQDGGSHDGGSQYGTGAYSQPAEQQSGAPYAQPGSPYGPPSPYAQPSPYGQYYGLPAVEPKGLSITSMVCGISSVLLGWFLIPQLAAIITGHLALGREPSGKGMSITGLVLGYLCLLGYGAFWLLLIFGLSAYRTSYGY
ncbi:DUF4190 domain-containing protein [Pseudarthrobacter sulfonivorans]|uniref:DUF4190 domain-containing protein n=1 Tax=Pseudarthrobacter sulfonivorans TaxID=121292 RepID=UPI002104D2F4|nr:DUF4190 domain-containing protein [Pseudarthrobacter sulfonivorans]